MRAVNLNALQRRKSSICFNFFGVETPSTTSTLTPGLERKKEDSCSLTLRKMAPIKSKAWKYFIKEKNNLVVCNFCKKKLKFSNNTSNMFQHLKLKHAAEVDKFKVR